MTTADEDWRPSASLPRRPTDQERDRALAAIPRGRLQRRARVLWVQRLESVTLESGADVTVFHPDYEEFSPREDEFDWSGLATTGKREVYRGSQRVPLRLRQAADEARARLEELREANGAACDVELVVRGEDVAVLRQGRTCLGFGLVSGQVLGRWRPREATPEAAATRKVGVREATSAMLGSGLVIGGALAGGLVGGAALGVGVGLMVASRAFAKMDTN